MMGDDDERCRHADADAQPHNVGGMIRKWGDADDEPAGAQILKNELAKPKLELR